jgi:superfamily II DNA/RNA helicase
MTSSGLSTSFAALGVAPEIVHGLAAAGITAPLPVQALTLADAIAGRDLCGKAKTGSGKTLAFGIPILQTTSRSSDGRPGALVLVPTRELAVQVGDVLAGISGRGGPRVTALYGGVPIERHIRSLRQGTDVIVATPGRLIDLLDRREVNLGSVSICVLDEADRMADMGFMPQVTKILAKLPEDRQTMLFSATLDGDVDVLVRRFMHDPVRHEVESPTDTVTSMAHHFFRVDQGEKSDVVATLAHGAERLLVFVRTRRGAERLAKQLRKGNVEADPIHGDLKQNARQRTLDRFSSGALPVLVATDVAARGIDVAGLGLVVQYDPPEDHKAYLHRSGRTARAGANGVVVTLLTHDQRSDIQKMQRKLGLSGSIVNARPGDQHLVDLSTGVAADMAAMPRPVSISVPGGAGGRMSSNGSSGGSNASGGGSRRNDRGRGAGSGTAGGHGGGGQRRRSGPPRPAGAGAPVGAGGRSANGSGGDARPRPAGSPSGVTGGPVAAGRRRHRGGRG